ncbi:hypothetical protein Poly30_29910 [Planctomycetes bacterium Poly30]|uniref:DUF1800 domain-containing protein n=1 Tax=Saltatorellus ferox TaxID=2528018 RepID=A0A518ETS0_9BACT|nr:hypothetical protein Poly30_29910 [Planctomycetes bacterium Poly30]
MQESQKSSRAPASPTSGGPNRRTVLRGSAAVAAAAASATVARATPASLQAAATMEPSLVNAWALGRASFGVTRDMLNDVAQRGLDGWVDWQLQPLQIDDSALEARLASFEWLGWSAAEMNDHPTKEVWEIAHEARAVRLLRATYSKRQLFERIVEFWTDHFSIYGSADDTFVLKIVDDEEVIRTHALGRFQDLLQASARSPAMIAFLDNDTNVVGAAQENYAREVMELHTLGVDGPYTENDVRELARCFTGWTYWKPWESMTQYGEFRFRPQQHDTGAKTVLGVQLPAGGGIEDAEILLDHLADHPSTIDFVTTKLAKWLLGYAPPQAAIDAARARWIATGGEIREVVRSLLSEESIRLARPWREPKLKRPFHWIVSLYRATGIDLPTPTDTIWMIWNLGQPPFQWKAPNGYPDVEGAWASLLMPRWQQAAVFGQGWYWSSPHTIGDIRALLGSTPMSGWAQHLSMLLTGGTMRPREVKRIQQYINGFSQPTDQIVGEALELVASSPSFGRY